MNQNNIQMASTSNESGYQLRKRVNGGDADDSSSKKIRTFENEIEIEAGKN